MSRRPNDELDDILRHRGQSGVAARWRFRLLFLFRFLLARLASICPLIDIRVLLARLRGVQVGRDVYIGINVELDYMFPEQISIGDHSGIGNGTSISAHHSIPMDSPLKKVYPRTVRPVRIGRGVDCNLNVIIQPGVTVGDYAVIGSGAVVTRDVPPMVLAAGVPARPKKDLSEEIRPHIPAEEFALLMGERCERFGWPPETTDDTP